MVLACPPRSSTLDEPADQNTVSWLENVCRSCRCHGRPGSGTRFQRGWLSDRVTVIDGSVYYDVMPRPERHSADGILDVARDLVLREGARRVTMDRIVASSGAPKGSVYYRFSTVDDLLAAMWLRAVRRSQTLFLSELHRDRDPMLAAVAAGVALVDFAQQEPADARLLVALRREDLVRGVADSTLARQLREINEPLRAGLTALTQRLFGQVSLDTVERTTCAVVDLPHGAIRRHLISGTPIPSSVKAQLTAAIPAALLPTQTRTTATDKEYPHVR